MGKPVRVRVVGQLLRLAAVRPHAPDLHAAAAEGVVVDEGAVGRIVRSVVEPLARRDAPFVAAVHGDRVNVELLIAAADERQRLAVR